LLNKKFTKIIVLFLCFEKWGTRPGSFGGIGQQACPGRLNPLVCTVHIVTLKSAHKRGYLRLTEPFVNHRE
jgi:hypothetical protein